MDSRQISGSIIQAGCVIQHVMNQMNLFTPQFFDLRFVVQREKFILGFMKVSEERGVFLVVAFENITRKSLSKIEK